jgi:hypothetical protein
MQASAVGQNRKSEHVISRDILSRTRRLTFHRLANIFDLAKEELLRIPSQRSLGQSDVDSRGDSFKLMLCGYQLIVQRPMFKKLFIANFSVGLEFEINHLSGD